MKLSVVDVFNIPAMRIKFFLTGPKNEKVTFLPCSRNIFVRWKEYKKKREIVISVHEKCSFQHWKQCGNMFAVIVTCNKIHVLPCITDSMEKVQLITYCPTFHTRLNNSQLICGCRKLFSLPFLFHFSFRYFLPSKILFTVCIPTPTK